MNEMLPTPEETLACISAQVYKLNTAYTKIIEEQRGKGFSKNMFAALASIGSVVDALDELWHDGKEY